MNKGSTFLEVAVTVGVIAITSYIIITSLGGAKENVRVSNIQSSLGSIISTALACLDSGKPLLDPVPEEHICESSVLLWPTIPPDWQYGDYIVSSVGDATFSFSVKSPKDQKEIVCNQKGCSLN